MIAPLPSPEGSMNNARLQQLLEQHAEEVTGPAGHWQMVYQSQHVICMTDESNDRMRFISPVIKVDDLTQEQAVRCMHANFSHALDARYCIHDGVLWAAFIHPLSELSPEFALDGLAQTVTLVKNFGTTYSSGDLAFQ
ncbi:MAG: hypothetical protein AAF649_08310 [Verrucomicrobiota bacterium]